MRKLISLATLAIAAVAATSASAAVTFNLNNVQFSDGAIATGSFTTTDDLSVITGFSIKTGPGATSTGTTSGVDYTSGGFATFSSKTPTQLNFSSTQRQLSLILVSPLTSAGAIIASGSEAPGVGLRSLREGGTVTNNAIAAVPEPAAWAMMLAGFGLVGAASRSRRVRFARAAA